MDILVIALFFTNQANTRYHQTDYQQIIECEIGNLTFIGHS